MNWNELARTPSAKTKVGHTLKKLLLTTALLGAIGASPAWARRQPAITLWNAGATPVMPRRRPARARRPARRDVEPRRHHDHAEQGQPCRTGPNGDLTEGNIDIANTTNAVQSVCPDHR